MKRCIICRKTSVYMRLLWGVRNKKRARPRTRKEQQRRRGQSLNLFDLFEVDGQEQQIQAYLYVSCLISGLTCHMNQHDLGASLKSPALLVSNRTLQTSSHQQHILCWSNHTCANEQHLPKYSWFCSYLPCHQFGRQLFDCGCVFSVEAATPESNPICRYQSECRQSKFPGIGLNNPTNVN